MRLLGGQRDMLAELLEKLAVRAAEGLRLAATDQQCSEERALGHQRRDDNGVQAAIRQPLEQGERQRACIGLVDELPIETRRQLIRIHRHAGTVIHCERPRCLATRACGTEGLDSQSLACRDRAGARSRNRSAGLPPDSAARSGKYWPDPADRLVARVMC